MRFWAFAGALLSAMISITAFAQNTPTAATGTVSVAETVPFAEGAVIAGAVRRECELGEKLSTYIKEYGHQQGVAVTQVAQPKADADGRVLMLEITDSMAGGNAFLGHHTYTTVKGTLYQSGERIGSFVGRRNSMGGAFGGFKGNCSVLGRTVKVLGEDIAGWLAHPSKDGQLGDLQ